mmetsp:Transcript_16564/g.24342  ORF Transcript_16564/g.24342 Transcript_16564/m.24342 type:complete len:498 (+) Transcript_16564:209-1702(+)
MRLLAYLRDPAVLVTIVATVDAADSALFGASFKAMETEFGFTPGKLGVLQMWQSLSFSLSLPVWGAFLPVLGARYLLISACLMWAATTLLTPIVSIFELQCLLRCINGAALSGVMPITQAILADAVESSKRGAAFGWLQALHTLAKVLVSYSVLSLGDKWAHCYYVVFVLTLLMIILLRTFLPPDFGKHLAANAGNSALKNDPKSTRLSLSFWSDAARVVHKIIRIPTFGILVLQGVAGGTPWNAMGFLNVYWAALGFTNQQVARISALTNTGALFGTLFGGYLGDFAARRSRYHGRIFTAQASVLLGMPAWYMLLSAYSPTPATATPAEGAYTYAIASGFLFFFVGTWTATGANRPICADLVQEPGERAQVVAIWVMIEGAVGSMFGAPLIGFISELNGYDIHAAKQSNNASILSSALFRLGFVCWSVCFMAWCTMHMTLPNDLRGLKDVSQEKKEKLNDRDVHRDKDAVEMGLLSTHAHTHTHTSVGGSSGVLMS